jgi:hypothetical protein
MEDKKIRNSNKGINKFKRSCQERTNLEKNEKGDLLTGLMKKKEDDFPSIIECQSD